MDIGRRTLIGGALGAGLLVAASASGQTESRGPTPALGDPDMPFWPAVERFKLWPGKPPGAPAAAITPNWTMNGRPGARELWLRGIAEPEVHVFRPARPDGSALLAFPGGGYHFLSVQNEGLDVAQHFNPAAPPSSSSPIGFPAKDGPIVAGFPSRMRSGRYG
jgi:hypothetical protein